MTYRPKKWWEDKKDPIPLEQLKKLYARPLDIETALGAGGPLAKAIEGYRPRSGQLQMAAAVRDALQAKEHLIVEGPTGTGKSLAYLIPAVLSRKRTVVATATKSLQFQIIKDLNFLEKHLKQGVTFQGLFGRGEYACIAKDPPLDPTVSDWLHRTTTGLLSELPIDLAKVNHGLYRDITVTGDDCAGQHCDFYNDCYLYNARFRAAQSDIVVTNHALVAMDLFLDGALLPPYETLIIDEAHHFENYVRGNLEEGVSNEALRRQLVKLKKLTGADIRPAALAASQWLAAVREAATGNAIEVSPTLRDASRKFSNELWALLADARGLLESLVGETRVKAQNVMDGLDRVSNCLGTFLDNDTKNNRVLSAERDGENITIRSTPVEVGGWLKYKLWEPTRSIEDERPVPTVVLTSATLATGPEDFSYVKRNLGLWEPREEQVPSPFNFDQQLLWYVPTLHGDPNRKLDYAKECAPVIGRILTATRGRAFVLFTSFEAMDLAAELYKADWPMMTQRDASKTELVAWFKSAKNPVLFGTGSFWEGVDIPGRQLSCVIVPQIPFPVPTDPVVAARMKNEDSFAKLMLPHAITQLSQGFGRVIRRETDRGLAAILDPRIRNRRYGQRILDAMPGSPVVHGRYWDGRRNVTTLEDSSLPYVSPSFLDIGGAA